LTSESGESGSESATERVKQQAEYVRVCLGVCLDDMLFSAHCFSMLCSWPNTASKSPRFRRLAEISSFWWACPKRYNKRVPCFCRVSGVSLCGCVCVFLFVFGFLPSGPRAQKFQSEIMPSTATQAPSRPGLFPRERGAGHE
jgi:hypothetical protein